MISRIAARTFGTRSFNWLLEAHLDGLSCDSKFIQDELLHPELQAADTPQMPVSHERNYDYGGGVEDLDTQIHLPPAHS